MATNPCCLVEANLLVVELARLDIPAGGIATRIVRRCQVCGRRHFKLLVPPIKIGLKTTEPGG
jgi:hypothetical protein